MVIDKRICETRGPCEGEALRWWGSAMVGLCEGGALRGWGPAKAGAGGLLLWTTSCEGRTQASEEGTLCYRVAGCLE